MATVGTVGHCRRNRMKVNLTIYKFNGILVTFFKKKKKKYIYNQGNAWLILLPLKSLLFPGNDG